MGVKSHIQLPYLLLVLFRASIVVMFLAGATSAALASANVTAAWTQRASAVAPLGPGNRGWIKFGYDSGNRKIFLMAGSSGTYKNDVWQYDSGADGWLQIEPYVGCEGVSGFVPPTPRDEQVAGFDPVNSLYWMFGGTGYGCSGLQRTAQSGTNATTVVDASLPSTETDNYKDWTVRAAGVMAYVSGYDPVMKRITLATPISALSPGTMYYLYPQRGGGTWFYSTTTQQWGSLTGPHWGYTGPEPNRKSPAFAYSARDNAFIMFGGAAEGPMNDTWALDVVTKSWVRMKPNRDSSSPPARIQLQNSMVYDSAHDVFILFGGQCKETMRCVYDSMLDDTWAYQISTNSWTKLNPPISPPPRQQHHMAYDPVHQLVILYGGVNRGTPYSDLWAYDYATNTWTQLAPNVSPPARYLGAFEYDPSNDLFVLYGGNGSGGVTKADVWTLKLESSGPSNVPPSPVASVTPLTGVPGTIFQFDGSGSTDPDGTIVAYQWNFGDGSNGNGAQVSHSYAMAGTYNVTLTVTDDAGATAAINLQVAVSVNTLPPLDLNSIDLVGTVGDPTVTQLLVNGVATPVANGAFRATVPLNSISTVIELDVTNAVGTTHKTVTINVQ